MMNLFKVLMAVGFASERAVKAFAQEMKKPANKAALNALATETATAYEKSGMADVVNTVGDKLAAKLLSVVENVDPKDLAKVMAKVAKGKKASAKAKTAEEQVEEAFEEETVQEESATAFPPVPHTPRAPRAKKPAKKEPTLADRVAAAFRH